MKIGYGFYAHMLNDREFAFARQAGATHAVVHLVDYTRGGDQDGSEKKNNQPVGNRDGWGRAGANPEVWEPDYLHRLKARLADAGLELAAIENFDPADWYDVLLGGPRRAEQLERLKQIIRNIGKAGIPVFGYNFSIAGVASRESGAFARGGAESVGMNDIDERPIPNGMVWNMVYDPDAPPGELSPASEEELWQRLEVFLSEIIPVAEEAGVVLAAHPDDPPVERVRGQPRLVWRPDRYDRLLDLYPSASNKLEFCLGTLAEMPGHDLLATLGHFLERDALGYVHFRNVHGTAPAYVETFIDDGDIDMLDVMRLLKRHNYDGVLIPDHTPQMSCNAPWHAGMAYALGYMHALNTCVEEET
jgi:mannonate dehydratase